MSVTIYQGDCLEVLRQLPEKSVNSCVTSPPYYGLRDYGNEAQIGLEETPQEFIQNLVAVFREVKRVLRDDGTCWVNMGDSYSHGGNGGRDSARWPKQSRNNASTMRSTHSKKNTGMKPKDLKGMPWRLAFALQDDGWYLRQDIIWSKPNPMPESVTDRCTKAHEYIFLLSKSPKYYYDAKAIEEECTQDEFRATFRGGSYVNNSTFDNAEGGKSTLVGNVRRSGNKERKPGSARGCPEGTGSNVCGSVPWEGNTRNKRSVWTVGTKAFKEAHFATFPPDLIEPCILAGSPKGGMILDPFMGAGTTGLVADRFQRDCIGVELNPEYIDIARRRIESEQGMFSTVQVVV